MSKRITVQLNVKAGQSPAFEAVIRPAMARVRAEDDGCEMYDLFKSVDDDHRYAIIESWASQDAVDGHRKSDAMSDMAKIADHLEGRAIIHRYEDRYEDKA